MNRISTDRQLRLRQQPAPVRVQVITTGQGGDVRNGQHPQLPLVGHPDAPIAMPRKHHHVYVIELSKEVLKEGKFARGNPGYRAGKPCVYVGMTGLDPDVRFDKHKAGIQANAYVLRYGLQLLPDLYEAYNPLSYKQAVEMEIELAILLREAGLGVWQA